MLDFLISVIALIVTLGILVTFHEFGHFWVARRCGVKVLRFSIGFGKAAKTWIGKDGVEYVIAPIPLGGYVKMLGQEDTSVPDAAEVPASQRDHLESWISKRVGTKLVPPDLAASGFALMGGRVLPSEDGVAGLFMYENDAGARLTLYIAPQAGGGDSAFRYAGEGATQGLYWQDGPLGYAVVGQMPRDRLRTLAEEAYDQLL